MTVWTKVRRLRSTPRKDGPGQTAASTLHEPPQWGEGGAEPDVPSYPRAAAHSQLIRGEE